eukprot:Em0011g124a
MGAQDQIPVVQPVSSMTISVANGSDVTVQARCDNGSWTGVSSVEILPQYGTWQQNGLLSAFPATQFNFTSLNCSASQLSSSSPVVFNRVNTFFFDRLPVYSAASNSSLLSLCTSAIPGIPGADVSVSVQSNYAYCKGKTQRGNFRSSSIRIPDFVVQPQDVSLMDINSVAVLSCAVTPGSSAQSIQWYFQADNATSSAVLLNQSSTIVIESVIQGASVLVLYNQSISLLPGLYYCQVSLVNQTLLNSRRASVVVSGTYDAPLPPSRLQIAYGESGFLTYIPGDGGNITCSNYGNLNVTTTNFTAYIILPPVGEQNITCANYTTILMVTAPLGFTMSLGNYETVVQQGSAVSLQCSVNSSDAQVQWLKDMQPVGSGNFYNISNVQKSNSGMYQCLVQPPNSSQSALVSSTYLNVYFFNNISINGSSTVLSGSFPVLNLSVATTPPTLVLICVVDAYPPPPIVWRRQGQVWMAGVVQSLVGFMEPAMSQLSVSTGDLSYVPEVFECVAANRSTSFTINALTTPRTSPDPVSILPSARVANISWAAVRAALPPVTFYQLNVTLLPQGPTTLNNTTGTSFLIQNLLPFRNYSVAVTPFNSIGGGPTAFGNWTTLEAAPSAPPQNLITSVTEIKKITVSWNPPLAADQNGMIIGYMVTWSPWLSASSVNSMNVTAATYTIANLKPGTWYQIQVAARTGAGVSMFSKAINASTFPEFDNTVKPSADPTTTTTTTITINITLPSNLVTFSHLWVIVMRLNDSLTQQINGGTFNPFTSNATFANYSLSVPAGSPYVAAELPGNRQSPLVYILGNESQQNDAPGVHPNKALMPGTTYTAFVWGFFSETNTVSSKREASANARQYVNFSSSGYLAPVKTASTTSAAGATAGQIAGGVIGAVLGVMLLVALVLVAYVLLQRQNSHKGYSLPPRKGSFRIPETSVVKPPKSLPISFNDLIVENQHQPLIVEQFANHVRQLHANSDHLFSEEYELFTIKSPNLPHMASCLPCNVNKNRYANINSFDDTRVCLSLNPGIEGSDYINANYIDGFQQKHAYIATQGPLPSTTYDFWKMVWEQNSCCIIMLTNLVEKTRAKCHQYWPEVGSIILEDLVITLVESQELAYYTVRTFQMKKEQESYEVKQRLENFKRTTDGPDIIHCSAGVGRTGTLIAIQELIKMANLERKVDVFNFALELRKQRSYMIQTEHQYIFIHDTLLEVIRDGNTQTSPQRFQDKSKEMKDTSKQQQCEVLREFERAQELQVVKASQFSSAKLPPNVPKNRSQSALPYDLHRVRLLMQPGVSGSDYINASFVDGYERKQQYILAQGPMRNTVDDFWRMIWEQPGVHHCHAVLRGRKWSC